MIKNFLTILVVFCGCSPPSPDPPANLISQEKMIMIISDIHVLEAKVMQLRISERDSMQAMYSHYERLLFKDYEVSKDQYEESFVYYVDHPDEFQLVYEAVVDTLELRKQSEIR